MPSPFPGMDPYLESSALWPDVHQRFITYLSDAIQPRIRPQYNARIGERLYVVESTRNIYADIAVIQRQEPVRRTFGGGTAVLEAPPVDAPVIIKRLETEYREPFIEIYHGHSSEVVTVIEVLSPANKQAGPGRDLYVRKQQEIMHSAAHLIEIDLLAGGIVTVDVPHDALDALQPWRYLIAINRAERRHETGVYALPLAKRLPVMPIPLRAPDADVQIDLQAVLNQCYDNGGYEDLIDYRAPPTAQLSDEEAAWMAKEIVKPS